MTCIHLVLQKTVPVEKRVVYWMTRITVRPTGAARPRRIPLRRQLSDGAATSREFAGRKRKSTGTTVKAVRNPCDVSGCIARMKSR